MIQIPVVAWVGAIWLWGSVKAIPAWWLHHKQLAPVKAARELCLKKDKCDAYEKYANTATPLEQNP